MPKATMPKDHPSAALTICGARVQRGKSVDVDEETAASLEEQGWAIAPDKPPAKKPADKTTASPDADTKES